MRNIRSRSEKVALKQLMVVVLSEVRFPGATNALLTAYSIHGTMSSRLIFAFTLVHYWVKKKAKIFVATYM